jgi:hypothetical protein
MTDETQPIRQTSGNLQEFQAAIVESEARPAKGRHLFVEGDLDAPQASADGSEGDLV